MIEVKNLTKIYGHNTEAALEMLKKGASNQEIKDKTKQVVGVRNILQNHPKVSLSFVCFKYLTITSIFTVVYPAVLQYFWGFCSGINK
jgi:hypothetical protein